MWLMRSDLKAVSVDQPAHPICDLEIVPCLSTNVAMRLVMIESSNIPIRHMKAMTR